MLKQITPFVKIISNFSAILSFSHADFLSESIIKDINHARTGFLRKGKQSRRSAVQ